MHSQDYQGMKIIIASDSKSAIQSLCSTEWKSLNNDKIIEIKEYYKELQQKGNDITILWTPGHEGIPGNEKADEVARMALENGDDYEMKKYPEMVLATNEEELNRSYHRWYDIQSHETGIHFESLHENVQSKVIHRKNAQETLFNCLEWAL